MEWSHDDTILLRILADEIEAVERLRHQSEPFYLFIVNKKVTSVFRGVNPIRFEAAVKKELEYYRQEKQGFESGRPKYEISEPTPAEMDLINTRATERQHEQQSILARHTARLAVRKRHRAKLLAPHLTAVDFVLYWPHATHAHPELYERWNENS
ncbi:hypothetical protein O0L34_g7633 [Tuta absoluta]|nr:hypothetical protein O0L34_g7633 [Tuta absoluta]